MKKLFSKICLVVVSALSFGLLTGCEPQIQVKPFSVSFQGFGPGYVTLMATVPSPTTVAYIVSEKQMDYLTPTMLNMSGKKTIFYSDGEQQILDYELKENTKYYVYLVALL